MFYILLMAKGCVGQMGLALGGYEVGSTNANLSAFGRDMSHWPSFLKRKIAINRLSSR